MNSWLIDFFLPKASTYIHEFSICHGELLIKSQGFSSGTTTSKNLAQGHVANKYDG